MGKKSRRCGALALILSVLLSLAACGGSGEANTAGGPPAAAAAGNDAAATSMHLMRTEGTVAVSDGGKDLTPRENMGLYSGYGVKTREESYAWINLDDVKLTKMDERSGIAIEKENRTLEIKVEHGSLFFNVTEPLADDETMNIRASTMMLGIRGTCGWVVEWSDLSRLYLLEGTVECLIGEETIQINAGEMIEATSDGQITKETFTTRDIPDFVWPEIGGKEELTAAVPVYSRFRNQYGYVPEDELPSETKEILRQVLDAAAAQDWDLAGELAVALIELESPVGGSVEWDGKDPQVLSFYSEFDGNRFHAYLMDYGEPDGKDEFLLVKSARLEIRPQSGLGCYLISDYGVDDYDRPAYEIMAALGQCEDYNWTGDFEVNMNILGADIPVITEADVEDEYNKWND